MELFGRHDRIFQEDLTDDREDVRLAKDEQWF
jgi:hypothetical protein